MSAVARAEGGSHSSGSGGSVGKPKATGPPRKTTAIIVKKIRVEISTNQDHFAGFHGRRQGNINALLQ